MSVDDTRMRIASLDSRLVYTLPTVPDDAHQEAQDGFARRARELADEVAERAAGEPQWSERRPDMRAGAPQAFARFAPTGYGPGVMLAWTVNGTCFTGQVWANLVRSGTWNGRRGQTSAVVVATVNGRRARRDEAICLPLVHGRQHAHAFVATAGGNAAVEVLAPQRSSEGLFDVVATTGDPVTEWESEGGYAPMAEVGIPAAPAGPVSLTSEASLVHPNELPETVAEAPTGAYCPRCNRNTVFGIECAYGGHIIITAWAMEPRHPPAWTEGCCPRCLAANPQEMFEMGGRRIMCAACAGEYGGRSWRERARRVVAWVDNPSEAHATQYADGPGSDGGLGPGTG
ncbi:hypothetical protein [Streptomyces californicus]|uniref:hypothetical protein n=1 Tax=Streptomyces californicus TaxID=67351 RepID=UPI00296EDC66|nr:hypothetical protein [Streptomyces californicus]MDW4912465.1 hypothetical protein [Streptomyces californicus]